MTLRTLFHMARADFFERTRRYSFLVMLGWWSGLATFLQRAQLVMSVPPYYVGETNSPWVGALMTVTVTMFLAGSDFILSKARSRAITKRASGRSLPPRRSRARCTRSANG
jgi:hypothetical protein